MSRRAPEGLISQLDGPGPDVVTETPSQDAFKEAIQASQEAARGPVSDDIQARIDAAVAVALRNLQAGQDLTRHAPSGPYKAPVPTDAQLGDPEFVATHCTGGRPGCGSTRDLYAIRDDGLARDKPWKCKPCRQGGYREDGSGPLAVIPPPNMEHGVRSPSQEAYDAWVKGGRKFS